MSATASTPQSDFYLGEAYLISGDVGSALGAYRDVVEGRADPWFEEFQMLACTRIAEIHGLRGEYAEAADWLDKAMDYYQKEFLVDWLLEGRRRFYDRLRDGDSAITPRLLDRTG
jgi:hypothetical protein